MSVAHTLEEPIAWQLSTELRDAVITCAQRWEIRDRKLFEQIRDSARSAPRNLAEGFGRFKPREFAKFTRIARGSLMETRNHVKEAVKCHYITEEEAATIRRLNARALAATTRLLEYLDSCKGEAPTGWDVRDKKKTSNP
jgi:four helix bundle protein